MMIKEKNKVRLGEFAEVISGYAFKSKKFQESGVPIIKIKNIRVGDIDLNDVQFVDENYLELDAKYHVNSGDILISLTGSHLTQPNSVVGRVAKYSGPKALLNQRAGKITISDSDIGDKDFIYYTLSSEDYKRKLALFASGAASQANISPSQVKSVELDLPDLPTQQKIASILSAFDDLIENNTRRIAILEQMTRLIYCEWFVHYRYPGHEKDKMVDLGTEFGEAPEGWEVKEIDEIVKRLSKGKIYRKKNVDDSGRVIVIDQSTDEYLGFHNNEPDFLASFERPHIIFGDHTCKTQLLTRPFSLGPNVVPFISENDKLSIYYLYWLVEGLIDSREYKRHWSSFKVKKIPVAPINITSEFEDKVASIYNQIELLNERNRKLKQTRDLLLPRLISGKVGV
ncbi:MAG: restriction endonuclease subunit S [Balneolaceae bacterium]